MKHRRSNRGRRETYATYFWNGPPARAVLFLCGDGCAAGTARCGSEVEYASDHWVPPGSETTPARGKANRAQNAGLADGCIRRDFAAAPLESR